jgi:hypothetical protein
VVLLYGKFLCPNANKHAAIVASKDGNNNKSMGQQPGQDSHTQSYDGYYFKSGGFHYLYASMTSFKQSPELLPDV